MTSDPQIVVIGLGYVGLPLAVALANKFDVVGFDVNAERIAELEAGNDRTGEVSVDILQASSLALTLDTQSIQDRNIYIVTVPTPVDEDNVPDLSPVRAACKTVGSVLGKGAIVVFESTVYPGVTEDICGPALEEVSGLKCGEDFFLGYSPERINPGDTVHTVDKIIKVVAGQTPEIAQKLADMYGAVITAGTFIAANIKTAEAAKVIENAQRDINIAFVNEVAAIFHKLGISAHDVLEAARTKWNFLGFEPGLVGGHCIGVDPYYLAHRAKEVGHNPEVILAGRRINDSMGTFVADAIADKMEAGGLKGPVLMLGLTFKENVPDLRNTKVIDVVAGLKARGLDVDVHDAMADAAEARTFYDIDLISKIEDGKYACIIGAVPHDDYRTMTAGQIVAMTTPGGLIADIKGMWRKMELPAGYLRWQL
ncbi:MAG: nucleotide sugar dehydrogenase [Alphaproteobacteria bacterium]|jgi:UDP-N-acetyl-D-glucosamine/UDP-N-acetyl-D-galactosamine dehydrogenase|nr:nucleotide sugar dehydrogenase [Alphaproteobacteria bacterium]MBT4083523.1 nucleotide sugar dehydrogenase [Alphaproteobacteria bacterium]MBT4546704.1 nucleotide sugar dehydrogenase [Alphaproteobacteria bacterium]MBT7747301.1 nucleotide sugar dehydrogenase [Alphaproteobacteria bacterium]